MNQRSLRRRTSRGRCAPRSGSTLHRGRRGRVDFEVVDDVVVDCQGLGLRHAQGAITSRAFTFGRNRRRTANSNPQHVETIEGCLPTRLRSRPAKKHVVDNHVCAGTGHCRDAVHPSRLERPERRTDAHDSVRRLDVDPAVAQQRGGGSIDESVDAESQPVIWQGSLQTDRDLGLTRTGTAVENYDISDTGIIANPSARKFLELTTRLRFLQTCRKKPQNVAVRRAY